MLFSIIIPVYNTEEYIEQCLESVINQTYTNLDIIIINDGSTDNSGVICDEYVDKDSRIRVIHKENGGLSDARNIGVNESTGDYIIFVDSDDYIEINTCEVFYSLIKTNQHIDVILAKFKQDINNKIYYKNNPFSDDDTKMIVSGKEYLEKMFLLRTFTENVWCNIYSRYFLKENNLFFKKDIFHEDVHWLIRVLLSAERVICNEFVFYINRADRPNSITTSKDATHVLKRAESLLIISYDLINHISGLEDGVLKKLILNYIVSKFFEGFILGKFHKQVCRVPINTNSFLLKDLDFGNKIKVISFRINPLFCYLLINYRKRLSKAKNR